MSRRNGKFLFLFLFAILFLYYVFTVTEPESKIEKSSVKNEQPERNSNKEQFFNKAVALQGEAQDLSIYFCEEFNQKVKRNTRKSIQQQLKPLQWHSHLEAGYSITEIIAAIDYLGSPNAALNIAIQAKKNASKHAEDNRKLNDYIENVAPDLLVSSPFVFSVKVPQNALAGYTSLSKVERQRILADNSVNVDDVAFFMADDSTTDDMLFELISALDNPNDVVGYSGFSNTASLLDYALFHRSAEIVNLLLDRGASTTQQIYVGGSLDWALARIHYFNVEEDEGKWLNIIKRLIKKNATAQLTEQSYTQVVGGTPTYSYSFNESEIIAFIEKYNVDLTTMKTAPLFSANNHDRLIKDIEDQALEDVKAALNIENLAISQAECNALLTEFQLKWSPKPAKDIIKKARLIVGDNPKPIEDMLKGIDPVLVDEYRKNSLKNIRSIDLISEKPLHIDLSKFESMYAAILHFENMPLTDSQKNYVVDRFVSSYPTSYALLLNSSLMEEPIPFRNFEFAGLLTKAAMQSIADEGLSNKLVDESGKTLLHYVSAIGDIELIKFLYQNNFPFKTGVGADPLHYALDASNKYFKPELALNKINALMAYKPTIDEYHIHRMALIKLKYPELYQAITSSHTGLEANEGTKVYNITR